MPLKRCEHGHFYDPQRHPSCPYCGNVEQRMDPTVAKEGVRPASGGGSQSAGASEPTIRASDERGSMPGAGAAGSADERTVGVIRKKTGMDPVVGWLVCVEGPDKGRDFRIKTENNAVGRSRTMDIAISGDDSISRDRHAIVTYEPRSGKFLITPGDARGLVYVNDEVLSSTRELSALDAIEMGETRLLFVPFCGEGFSW